MNEWHIVSCLNSVLLSSKWNSSNSMSILQEQHGLSWGFLPQNDYANDNIFAANKLFITINALSQESVKEGM